jgi:S-adenosylhomocysteine hydrolase
MKNWISEFVELNSDVSLTIDNSKSIIHLTTTDSSSVVIANDEHFDSSATVFNLKDKTYTKKNSTLEVKLYKFLYGNKARFTPVC